MRPHIRRARPARRSAAPLWLLLAVLLCLPAAAAAQEAATGPPPGLLAELRSGGYAIYLRHTVAVTGARPGAMQALPVEFEDCVAPQRPLNAQGVAQAQAIARALADLGIPVGIVQSSPFCRCIETAWYAFGQPIVQRKLAGLWGADVTEREQQERTGWLRQALSRPPPPGTNVALVAHISNIRAAAELELAQGEAAVFRPTGDGFELVGRLMPGQWQELGP